MMEAEVKRMRFRKIYLEISNICNLSCRFCPKTKRQPRRLTEAELSVLLPKLRPYTDYLYFHLMGEPLCHPALERFLALAGEAGFRVILTTNGTLLKKATPMLLSAPALHKVNISLHAFEANDLPFEEYLDDCFAFGRQSDKLTIYRLWNQGGENEKNAAILSRLEEYFPKPWVQERRGLRIADKTYLAYGEKFDWPEATAEEGSEDVFCYGLHDHIGVLCDGTVVPCCLDHDGDLALGNLFRQDLEEILESGPARAIYNGFARGKAVQALCRRCGYARNLKR